MAKQSALKPYGERKIIVIDTLIYSLIVAIFVGVSAGYLGSLMVLEKMALVGDALSHVALPGIAIGILFGFNQFIGAFAFLFGSAVIIWQLQRVTKISFEALVGAMFTFSLAIGILLVPEPELLEALFGDITQVTLIDVGAAIAISIVAVVLTKLIYKKLVLAMISEDLAIAKGINVALTNLLYLFLVSLVVAMGIRIVGTLLVGFLVIVPAIAAKNLSSGMTRYARFSAIFGAISGFTGILLSGLLGFAPGPMVVFSGIAVFAITVVIGWKYKLTS
jgi:ABC-type Mn2+/Zn2+ transport system permease subunit